MLQEAILKFRSSGPILLPAIIDNYWLGEIKTYEDYAVLPYEVHEPQPLEKVLDMFEMNADLAILYHIVPSSATAYGHECCAYCYPVTERMFKITARHIRTVLSMSYMLPSTIPLRLCLLTFLKICDYMNVVENS